jgi:hypothetical protein
MTDEQSRRPAEEVLKSQLQAERERLLRGFESRPEVLRWGQRIAVRTLGQVPRERYHQLAKSFRPDKKYAEGLLVAAFIDEKARTRPLSADAADGLREEWAADVLAPTQVRSFRDLRKDAGEYIGDADTESTSASEPPVADPKDEAPAMRPALEELDADQGAALEMALGGLEDKTAILLWGDYLTQATRGEPVDPDRGVGAFIQKCYHEPSTVKLLTDTSDAYQRARQEFLCYWLLPAFNRAVQDLTRRTAEEPRETDDGGTGETPGWSH